MRYNPKVAKMITEMGRKSLSEIQDHLDKHFTMTTEGRLIPKNPGPDVIIIDHISLLK